MPSQAGDDVAVHFGKLLKSELVDRILDLAPGGAVVPAGTVIGLIEAGESVQLSLMPTGPRLGKTDSIIGDLNRPILDRKSSITLLAGK